jgi:hypothetical protein
MGNTYSYLVESTFYIYSRTKENDSYKLLDTLEESANPMSRFKHEVYSYALKKKHKEEKALYLYCGYARVAKCIRTVESDVPYITITFGSSEYAGHFDQCREQIPTVNKDMNWLQTTFTKSWVFQHHEDAKIRKFQNYRMDQ